MKFKIGWLSILIVFIASTLWARVYIMKFANIAPEDSPWHEALKEYKKFVEQNSNGQVKMKIYMGGQLGDENTMAEKTLYGAIECSGLSTGAVASLVPDMQVFELPFIWDSYEEYDYVTRRYLQPYFEKELRIKGLFLMGFVEHGWRNFHSRTKSIRTPADLVGMRVRSQQSKMHIEFWKTFGAIPVPIPIPRVLDYFKNGLIEGGSNTLILTAALGWYQYLKYITLSRHVFQPVAVMCNLKWWNSLPQKFRQLSLKGFAPLPDSIHKKLAVSEKGIIEGFKEAGIQIIKLTPDQRNLFKNRLKGFPERMVREGIITQKVLNLLYAGKKAYLIQKGK